MTRSTMNSILIALIGILVIWLIMVSLMTNDKGENFDLLRFRFTGGVTLPIVPERDYAAECIKLGGTAVFDGKMKLKRCLWTKTK